MARRYRLPGIIVCLLTFASTAMAQEISVAPEDPPLESVPAEPVWTRVEYLYFAVPNRELPVLLTSGSIRDPRPGAIGQAGTQALIGGNNAARFGGTNVDFIDTLQSGMRLTLGFWLDAARTLSLEGNYLTLFECANQHTEESSGAPGSRLIARPFFNANTLQEDADPVAVPDVMRGTVRVSLPRQLLGTEANLRYSQPYSIYSLGRVSCLVGFRYLSLQEGLEYSERIQDLPGLGQAGNQYAMDESFRTSNHFYGGQVGIGYDAEFGSFQVGFAGKLAFGNNSESIRARATTQIREGNGVVSSAENRGLLVQPSNAGIRSRNEIVYIPEVNLNLAWVFNQYVRVTVGYSYLYWNKVLHPENQIDRTVNMQALQPFDQVGTARPAPFFRSEAFWTQGLSLGIQFNF